MRHPSRLFRLLAALAFLAGSAPAAASDVKAVIELFTSQGCSSCPKADRLLGEMSNDPRLVALSLNVDYWDYLGWRDTLALSAHSARQKGYADQRGDRQIYTPQVVANGAAESIGNKRKAVERLLSDAEIKNKLTVSVSLVRKGMDIEINIGTGPGAPAEVWILAVKKEAPVKIKRGENKGKMISYANVVRSWKRIAVWNGEALQTSFPIAELGQEGADRAAVLVQPGSVEAPGPVRGAALIDLH